MAENNSSAPLKTAEGNDLAIDIAEHTAEADAICRKLYNQYGHEQTAKNAREWIQIAKQLLDDAPQAVAAQAPAGNWINADDVDRLVRELDVALHGENDAAPQAGLCDVVGLVKEAARKLGRPVLAAPAAVAVPTSHFDDPRVQAVYSILCGDETPPKGEHWEGFVARRIVDALATPALPATEDPSAGEPYGVAEPSDKELIEFAVAEEFILYCSEDEFVDIARSVLRRFGNKAGQSKAEVQAEPVAWLICRSAFRVSPDGQDAEGHEWLEEADEPGMEGSFPVYTAPQAQPADALAEPVAQLIGVDEYGPRLNWFKHWVDLPKKALLYTAPHAAALNAETPYQRDADAQGAPR